MFADDSDSPMSISNSDNSNDKDEDFDNLDDDEEPETPLTTDTVNVLPAGNNAYHINPEKRQIILPSTCLPTTHPLSKTEMSLRKQQAIRYITALQDVIAEKSFLFTHVVRHAPRKSVKTRGRAMIAKVNTKIALYAKMYGRCRAALTRLGADENTLDIFRKLTKDDLAASGAVKDPNTPGSTSLRLSWIWHMSSAGETSEHRRECMSNFHYIFQSKQFLVQRVHWLRARAQHHRWQEEKTLLRYEMQWTVRYFLYESEKWKKHCDSDCSPGAKAYASRQSATWAGRAVSANSKFAKLTPSHVSLL